MFTYKVFLKKSLTILSLFLLAVFIWILIKYFKPIEKIKIKSSLYDEVQILKIDGTTFRDLNKNNKLDIYEDHRLSSLERSEDLLSKMHLEEKIGQMFHPPFILRPDIWMFIYEMALSLIHI